MKLQLPKINLSRYFRPAIGLLVLAAFLYAGFLLWRIQHVEADPTQLSSAKLKLSQENLKFDTQTLQQISQPPRLKSAGRNLFNR